VHVDELTFDKVGDYPSVASRFLKNRHRTTSAKIVSWTRLKVIQCRKASPGSIFVKLEISVANFEQIDLAGSKRRTSRRSSSEKPDLNLAGFIVPPAYTEPPKVSAARVKDLLSILDHGHVEGKENVEFYEKFRTFAQAGRVEERDSDDE